MKIELTEHEHCFGIDLTPESMEDQVLLARLAVNGTKEIRALSVYANKDLTMSASVVIGKRRKPDSRLS